MDKFNYQVFQNNEGSPSLIATFQYIGDANWFCEMKEDGFREEYADRTGEDYDLEENVYFVVDLEEKRKEELAKPIITLDLIKELAGDKFADGVIISVNIVHQVRMNGVDFEMALFDKDLNYLVDLLEYDTEEHTKVEERMYDEVIESFGEYSGETLGSLFSDEVKEKFQIGRVYGVYNSDTKKSERQFGGQKSYSGTYSCEQGTDS